MTNKAQCSELLNYLKEMLKIRCFEEKVLYLYNEGQINGMCHLCLGQEAVAVGVCANITREDYITSTHRGHGHLLAKGGEPGKMLAELFGKATGYCKGRGGSMHIADVSLGHLGANGIVGAGIPIGCGAALAIKYKQQGRVVLSFFGDGATCQGVFHESLNMAALWKLPIIFICENNLYAVSTHVSSSCPTKDVSDKADAYGIEKMIVDGMDVLAVKEAVNIAVQKARQGGGPTFVECKTYSFYGHGTNNDRPYRTKEEEKIWQGKCPVNTFKNKLIKDKVICEDDYLSLLEEVNAEIEKAVKYAQDSPYPDPESVREYMFSE